MLCSSNFVSIQTSSSAAQILNISTVDYGCSNQDEYIKLAGPEPPLYATVDAENTAIEIEDLNDEMEIIKADFRTEIREMKKINNGFITEIREMKGVMDIQALRIEQLQLEIASLKLQVDLI
jgi:hypothetical protein